MKHRLRVSRRPENECDKSGGAPKTEKPISLLEAIPLAAAQVGYDGRGEGGLVGYLERIARTEPKLFMKLLLRLSVDTIIDGTEEDSGQICTIKELEERLRKKGLPLPIWDKPIDDDDAQ
jgi:hypothetical protein